MNHSSELRGKGATLAWDIKLMKTFLICTSMTWPWGPSGICPSAQLMHSNSLSLGGEQGIDKGMRWVKIITA